MNDQGVVGRVLADHGNADILGPLDIADEALLKWDMALAGVGGDSGDGAGGLRQIGTGGASEMGNLTVEGQEVLSELR